MIKLVLRGNRKWNLVQLRGTFCQIGDAHSALATNSLIHSCGAVAKPLSLMMSHFTSVWTWQDSTPRRPLVLYHRMVNLNWWSKFWNVSYCNLFGYQSVLTTDLIMIQVSYHRGSESAVPGFTNNQWTWSYTHGSKCQGK